MNELFSPGKLLLTSEYAVLDGALALALPTRLGQEFFYEDVDHHKSVVLWEAYHQGQLWFSASIDYRNWRILETQDENAAAFVLKVLREVQKLSTTRFRNEESYYIKTNLQFPANFGLGSSSTLMNNLGVWAEIDPYLLNENSLGGSGYDIAVAQKKQALLYQLGPSGRRIKPIIYAPEFYDELIFIHLNNKQDSRKGIQMYRNKKKSVELIEHLSDITVDVLECNSIEKFSGLMSYHEQLLSDFLDIPTVKESTFKDCPVFIKSLGAWGGDFILTRKFDNYEAYFTNLGYPTIINYHDMIGDFS